MKKFLVFVLACATSSLFLSAGSLLIRPHHLAPITVTIDSDIDPTTIVSAIKALHRQDVQIDTLKRSESHDSPLALFAGFSLFIMLFTGIALLFFKLYCGLLDIPPTL